MTPKLIRVVTQEEGTPLTKSRDHMKNKKRYIPLPQGLWSTNVYEEAPPLKSFDTSVVWSRDK